MHIEVLVEDKSGELLLAALLPKILGESGSICTWRLHSYRGIGRIPTNLRGTADPAKRILLDQLPRVLGGYAKTPGIDAVVVVLDTDSRDCRVFLQELRSLAQACAPALTVMFRLAIEEMEAWYLGDPPALAATFPTRKSIALAGYAQDSICGTWELLAEAVYPGGVQAIRAAGWPLPGQVKCEWAKAIGPMLTVDANASVSFCKFRDGLRQLVGAA